MILTSATLMCGVVSGVASDISASSDSIASVNLEEVAVVATRATEKTPIAFNNLTAADLETINQGVDIPYLLSMLPSVVVNSDAGAGIGYTGIRVRGTDSQRINVTANGVPINDPESHSVYWVNMPDIASSLKDIQVQRGAGTSTNGAGAFGGSINMVTASPSRTAYGEFDGTYGMYNTHKETLKAGTGLIGDHWAADIRLSNIGTDGYIERASSTLWSYFGQIGYYNEDTSIRLLAFGGKERTYMAWDYASKEEMEEFGRRYNPCGKYTDSNGNTAYYPDQFDNYAQHHFHLLGHHTFSPQWKLNVALHYTKGDGYYEQYKTRRTLSEYGLQPFYIYEPDENGDLQAVKVKKSDLVRLKKMDNGFGGAIFDLTYSNDKVSAVLGGAINGFHGSHFGQVAWVRNYIGEIDPLQEYYRNTGKKTDGNIYGRVTVDLYKGLTGYADLQYRHIKYSIVGLSDNFDWNTDGMQILDIHRTFNFFNPKAGLNYRIDKHNRAFASWSVAHKEPTRNNFIDCDPGRLPVAERLFDYELGYNYTNYLLSAGVNLYFMDYKNQLVATGQLSDTGNPVSENVPSSYRMGIEFQLGIKPSSWFEWQINATFSRNRVKDFVEYIYDWDYMNPITRNLGDTPIAFSPDVTLNNAFNFNYNGFDASLQSHYVSKQYLTNSRSNDMSLDAYFVSNLYLGYTFKIQGLKSIRLGCVVNNIFSEKYENNGWGETHYFLGSDGKPVFENISGYAAQAPINVLGTITMKF